MSFINGKTPLNLTHEACENLYQRFNYTYNNDVENAEDTFINAQRDGLLPSSMAALLQNALTRLKPIEVLSAALLFLQERNGAFDTRKIQVLYAKLGEQSPTPKEGATEAINIFRNKLKKLPNQSPSSKYTGIKIRNAKILLLDLVSSSLSQKEAVEQLRSQIDMYSPEQLIERVKNLADDTKPNVSFSPPPLPGLEKLTDLLKKQELVSPFIKSSSTTQISAPLVNEEAPLKNEVLDSSNVPEVKTYKPTPSDKKLTNHDVSIFERGLGELEKKVGIPNDPAKNLATLKKNFFKRLLYHNILSQNAVNELKSMLQSLLPDEWIKRAEKFLTEHIQPQTVEKRKLKSHEQGRLKTRIDRLVRQTNTATRSWNREKRRQERRGHKWEVSLIEFTQKPREEFLVSLKKICTEDEIDSLREKISEKSSQEVIAEVEKLFV